MKQVARNAPVEIHLKHLIWIMPGPKIMNIKVGLIVYYMYDFQNN